MSISDILTIIVVITILAITLGFVFYKKIVGISLLAIKIIFPLAVLIALSTLFLPTLYKSFVESNFQETTLAQNLKTVDKTLTQVSNVQINISNTINNFLGNGINQQVDEYQSDLYSQVLEFMVGVLRVLILTLSIVILVFTLYIRYSFAGSFEVAALQKQINELRHEVESLKLKVS